MTSSSFSLRDRLVMILERYVSPITVCSMLTTALSQRDPGQREIDVTNVMEVVSEVMVGLRLFCDQDKLPDLMFELAEFCDRETQPFHPVPSSRSGDIAKAVPSCRSGEMPRSVPAPSCRSGEMPRSVPIPSCRSSELPRGNHELSHASR